ncbi:hypothetical protein [Marinibactrum halimedae]|uniref:Uncharacterized protein n=1 Tax=Marinibactrum halimedae TaxID=1444977 RepID=A0AA37TAZ0_9GAMM|nr:hypothetical protein [Marinibactrum halimedae]MCD9460960.1 hypothetical protein [Marinibactrum halimedae]GLS28097.1 hypothetical protein GCM10007877_38160 [Marinibactrum halimedae]
MDGIPPSRMPVVTAQKLLKKVERKTDVTAPLYDEADQEGEHGGHGDDSGDDHGTDERGEALIDGSVDGVADELRESFTDIDSAKEAAFTERRSGKDRRGHHGSNLYECRSGQDRRHRHGINTKV